MKNEELINLLSLGEGQIVEFKSNADLKMVGPQVCAFLNSSGGYLVCGIKDDITPIGISSAETAKEKLERQLAKNILPSSLISLDIQILEGKQLIVIEVPKGKDIPYSFKNDIFIREGSMTQKADVETITDMIQRKQIEPERWERRFSDLASVEELSILELNALFESRLFVQDSDFDHTNNDLLQKLQRVSLAKYGRLTNACDILFGIHPAKRHPQTRVRAVCYAKKTDDTYRDFKQFDGPLTIILEKLLSFIEQNTPTKAHFTSDSVKRKDMPLFPREAMREGLVNAFAHRDYADFSGGIKVEISPEKVEIWNSGSFPFGIDENILKHGHISILRNPDISHVLYMRGYMEKLGRGSVLIREACKTAGLPEPKWSSEKVGVTLTFFAGQVTGQVTGQVVQLLGLFAGEMTRQELQDAVGLKHRDTFIDNYIKPALDLELIERTIPDKPSSRLQKYRLTAKGVELLKNQGQRS